MLRVVLRTGVTLLLSGLLMAAGLLVAPTASACSCAGGTTQELLDHADAVFTGRLLSREVQPPAGPVVSSGDPALHVFAVDTVVKGTVHEQQGILSPDSGASCGLELSGDGPFVVFATRSTQLGGAPFADLGDDQYAASLCGGTAPLTPAIQADLQALAPDPAPEIPLPGAAGTDARGTGDTNSFVPALAATGTLALLAAGGLLVRRRRAAS